MSCVIHLNVMYINGYENELYKSWVKSCSFCILVKSARVTGFLSVNFISPSVFCQILTSNTLSSSPRASANLSSTEFDFRPETCKKWHVTVNILSQDNTNFLHHFQKCFLIGFIGRRGILIYSCWGFKLCKRVNGKRKMLTFSEFCWSCHNVAIEGISISSRRFSSSLGFNNKVNVVGFCRRELGFLFSSWIPYFDWLGCTQWISFNVWH